MPHVGPVLEGHTFFCPRYGVAYSVTHSWPLEGDNNTAKCVVCLQITASWHSMQNQYIKLGSTKWPSAPVEAAAQRELGLKAVGKSTQRISGGAVEPFHD